MNDEVVFGDSRRVVPAAPLGVEKYWTGVYNIQVQVCRKYPKVYPLVGVLGCWGLEHILVILILDCSY